MLHSDICGSLRICRSPQLFAAYHVLLRLPVPRHSPCALLHLTFFRVPKIPLSSRIILSWYSYFGYCSFLPKLFCSKKLYFAFFVYLFYRVLFSFQGSVSRSLYLSRDTLVGSNGFEPSTSRLSGARSSLLSYEPMYFRRSPRGGDEEVRTLDLLRARQALSQLSYTPVLS